MKIICTLVFVFASYFSIAQVMIPFTGSKSFVSFHKETITWEDGVKTASASDAGPRNDILLTEKKVVITKKETQEKLTYEVKEVIGDQWGNFNFMLTDGGKVVYSTKREMLQVLEAGNNIEIVYYLE